MEILKDCPFCGNHAEYYHSHNWISGHGESSDSVGVACSSCDASFTVSNYAGYKVDERMNTAASMWNKRYEEDTKDVKV